RSMARLRAVVVIQAPGLGGRPAAGQRSTAMAKASWTASSAMSMSPKRRTRVAVDRPDSDRKIAAMSTAGSTVGSTVAPDGRLPGRLVLEGAHLDRGPAGHRGPGGQGQRLVEVGGGHDPEPSELLLGLGEGAVGGDHVAALGGPDDGGGGGRVQPAGEDPVSRRLELLVEGVDVLVHPLDLRLR